MVVAADGECVEFVAVKEGGRGRDGERGEEREGEEVGEGEGGGEEKVSFVGGKEAILNIFGGFFSLSFSLSLSHTHLLS